MNFARIRIPKVFAVSILLLFFEVNFLVFTFIPNALASGYVEMPQFVSSDRILVLAPHPDDETVFTGGVIQRAIKAGARVKVVLLTNGENNLLSFMINDKRFFFGPKRIIRMGAMRKQETVKAMGKLGLAEADVISLGYPDNSTLKIMTKGWAEERPIRGKFSHARSVPYADALSPGSAYRGESILKDIERVLLEHDPTRIFVSHPADMNPDHQALYLFLQIAIWNLEGAISKPQIYPYLVHANQWPQPKGFHPELTLSLPTPLIDSFLSWTHLDLTPTEISNKYKALHEHPSQISYAPKSLVSFIRQNELFSDYPAVVINGLHNDGIKLTYTKDGLNILIQYKLKKKKSGFWKSSIFLLGYRKGTDFSAMPKIEIQMRMKRFHIKDKKTRGSKKDVRLLVRGREVRLEIPRTLLGNPDYILSSIKTGYRDFSPPETSWRILDLV